MGSNSVLLWRCRNEPVIIVRTYSAVKLGWIILVSESKKLSNVYTCQFKLKIADSKNQIAQRFLLFLRQTGLLNHNEPGHVYLFDGCL